MSDLFWLTDNPLTNCRPRIPSPRHRVCRLPLEFHAIENRTGRKRLDHFDQAHFLQLRVNIAASKEVEGKYLGKKPSFDRKALTIVQDMLATGAGTTEISKASRLTRQTVIRVRSDMAGAEAALARWGQ